MRVKGKYLLSGGKVWEPGTFRTGGLIKRGARGNWLWNPELYSCVRRTMPREPFYFLPIAERKESSPSPPFTPYWAGQERIISKYAISFCKELEVLLSSVKLHLKNYLKIHVKETDQRLWRPFLVFKLKWNAVLGTQIRSQVSQVQNRWRHISECTNIWPIWNLPFSKQWLWSIT